MSINKELTQIAFKSFRKPLEDKIIKISSLIRVDIPQITLDIIKLKKKIINNKPINNELYNEVSTYREKIDKIMSCNYFVFCLVLEESERIELIADNFNSFNNIIEALNILMKNKKTLSRLKNRIDNYYV